MTHPALDRRRNAYRADLAAQSLRDAVDAARYVPGYPMRVVVHAAPMLAQPRSDAPLENEALFGETVTVYDVADGFAWGQLVRDSYVGYIPASMLAAPSARATHRVTALSTFLFPAGDIKSRPVSTAPLNAALVVVREDERFLHLADGTTVVRVHAAPLDAKLGDDPVAVAQRFTGTPYLWGGRTHHGIDCSGLVQIAMEAAGIVVPRDSDMQRNETGVSMNWRVDMPADMAALCRGDIICWQGHVGLYDGAGGLLHANAHHMAVVTEPLTDAIERIRRAGNDVLAVKRLTIPAVS